MFAHGQLHILNVIFRLTAVCEIAMSNKKDKLNAESGRCVFFVRMFNGHGGRTRRRKKGESAV